MSKSLQDQLLGAGLVDAKKAKQVSKQKRKDKNQKRRNKDTSLSESQAAAQKAIQDKQARDKALNLEQQKEAEKKALAAQVAQLVGHYKVSKKDDGTAYNFKDGTTVKTIHVDKEQSDELSRGRLCIAKVGELYELVPKPIADKIRERDESAIVLYNEKASGDEAEYEAGSDEEYYAQFEIPDDLDW